jgi:hypothetical protein
MKRREVPKIEPGPDEQGRYHYLGGPKSLEWVVNRSGHPIYSQIR